MDKVQAQRKDQHLINVLGKIRHRVDHTTRHYIHTASIVEYTMNGARISFDLRDLLTIGAITESDVLLTGKTGSGKTSLANGLMEALFGPGHVFSKTILPSMNASEFMDVDFPAIINGKKTLQQAICGIRSFEHPGIVLNEINRAPSVIQSLFIPLLDHELEVQGVPVKMGKTWKKGNYQFRIFTINEGGNYIVQPIDPAVRDRMTIEIPMDLFPNSGKDVMSMLALSQEENSDNNSSASNRKSLFPAVVFLKSACDSIPVSQPVKLFVKYLSGMSFCIRAPQGTKESIDFSAESCDGCHHYARFFNVCGNVTAPSSRILIKLYRISKAFAMIRWWKSNAQTPIMVTPLDILEAAPFVFYSKLNLIPTGQKKFGKMGWYFTEINGTLLNI